MMRAIAECSPLRVMSIRCSSVGICTWRQIYAGSAGSITLPRGFRHLSTLDRGRSSAHNKVRSVGQHSVQSFVWIGRRFLNEKVVNVPNIAESITECDLSEWFKGEGDYVELDEPVASLETDKISTNVNAPGEGIITEIYAKAGETIQIGSKLFKIDLDGKPPQDKNEGERKISPNKSEAGSSSKTEAPKAEAPKAEAPKTEAPKAEAPKAEAPKTEAPKSPKGDTGHGIASQPVKDEPHKIQSNNVYSREQVIVPMSRIRLKIAERLKDAQNQAAFLTTFNEVDMSAIINMRAKYGAVFLEKHKTKLGFMGVFLKACATALVNNPQVNALMSGKNLIYSDYVDISVAVATDKGLVTPVVRNCNALSIPSIEKELVNLSSKARTNKLAIEDMAGGTFTVSNGGVFGSLMGTPILNPPQSAILGMHATKNRPVDVNGKVEIRPMMYLALTYDHRIIDGKEAVTFLVNIKNLVEDPLRFVLEL